MKRCLLISIVVLCMVASTAPAQPDPTTTIDHYQAYLVSPPIPFDPALGGPKVILTDQWGTGLPLELLALEKFANPVDKNGEGILDFNLHYTWYRIKEPNVGRIVQIKNQFDPLDGTPQILTVKDAKYLLTPALKDVTDPDAQLPLVNHYKCYDADGPPVNRNVILNDQWGGGNPLVLKPVCFCNPVAKDHEGILYDIVDPFAHLTCYEILDGSLGRPAFVRDQFLQQDIDTSISCLLCVPTDKLSTVPTEESTWGQIKSLYK